METGVNDPRRPLLSGTVVDHQSKWRAGLQKVCGHQTLRRRVPITQWLPNYNFSLMLQDAIAGITVGLTSIPQGIAYAIIAGVPPQVGLYSSLFPGIVYAVFGSCKVVTVGPTAILAALLSKYVAISVDFAYLAALLSGCVIFLLGVLQLGFLLDFISKPVISGFTAAAALQIAAAQLRALFRIGGKSGETFVDAIKNFINYIENAHLWDTLLGFGSIIVLVLFKLTTPKVSAGDPVALRVRLWQYTVRARNALVVASAALLAFCLSRYGINSFALTGTIEGGLPNFGPPPFSTSDGNRTLDFEGMLSKFGPEGLVMPLVAILESIAIAKAFAGGSAVDNTQEMIAVGLCNIISSFCQSMPVTGSFTRTALNHASGVATPAGSLFKAALVLLAVTLMTKWFYFIPRATLAGIIIVAMMSILDLSIIKQLWRNSKLELLVYSVTVITGLTAGLEYGILAGAATDVIRVMFRVSRPQLDVQRFKVGNQDCITLKLMANLTYACAENLGSQIKSYLHTQPVCLVLDGTFLLSIDIGVAENIIAVILDVEKKGHQVLFCNFSKSIRDLFKDLHPNLTFVEGSIDRHVLVRPVASRVNCPSIRVNSGSPSVRRLQSLNKIECLT